MLISLSGTPGSGKTTATAHLDPDTFEIIPMNKLTENYVLGLDSQRNSLEVDIDAVIEAMIKGKLEIRDHGKDHVVIEGHLSHHLPVDLIIVLRVSPKILEQRLRSRDYSQGKVNENLEAEALSVITLEALESRHPVYEIDTTLMTPSEVASCIMGIIASPPEALSQPGGIINFTGEIMEWY